MKGQPMISFDPLWKTLESKNIGKMELRSQIGISKATFAKLGKNESVTLETVDKICMALDVSISDVVEITHASAGNGSEGG